MAPATVSIRPFIGAQNFELSKAFYRELGFEEHIIDAKMSLIRLGDLAFYLQDYYAKEWVENTMIFFEVKSAAEWFEHLQSLDLQNKYPGTKLVPLRHEQWGRECMVLDPAGVLIHFGNFH
ncbi:glyoxalase [Mucilaginibacter roseus]|uniref:Glyoxalase n=1 Tax=Mucilaginibacter roseus TaxID=1528868 RepID=A0ABS8U665_9SPHI|nr:glyoxalase [Mucilaginibacter roseus]MCD8741555.1 glyoxalase [Mucilaginibacter roseus]